MPSREWKRRIVGLKTQTRFSNWLHPLTDTKQLIFSWDSVCFWNSHLIQQHGGENGDEEKARGSQVGAIGPVNVLHPHLIQMFKLGHRGHGGVVLMVNSVQIPLTFIGKGKKIVWCLWYISVVSRVHNLLLSSWKFPLGKSQIHSCEFIQQCLVNSPQIPSWWNALCNTYIFTTALVDLSSWETQDSPKSAGHHF